MSFGIDFIDFQIAIVIVGAIIYAIWVYVVIWADRHGDE